MKLRQEYTKFFLRFFPLSWLLGLIIPFIYSLLIFNLGHLQKLLTKKKDSIIAILVVLLLFQILSVIPSFFYKFFSFERLIAVIHNISAFSFIILGYAIMYDSTIKTYLSKIIYKLFFITCLWIFIGSMYSLITLESLEIVTIPKLIGIDSIFVRAKFNSMAWHFTNNFPRSRVLATYPNGTGLILMLFYFLFSYYNFSKSTKFKLSSHLIFILCVFATGSRLYLVFSLCIAILSFIDNKKKLFYSLIFALPFFFIFAVPLIEDLFFKTRFQSNQQRLEIYFDSINLMLKTNPFTGLGIKPRIPEIVEQHPIGSHSTLLGYYVKCGVFYGTFVLIIYIKLFYEYLKKMFNYCFGLSLFNKKNFYFSNFFIMIIIASLFEDFDAYELVPFLFGIVLWIYYKEILKKNKT